MIRLWRFQNAVQRNQSVQRASLLSSEVAGDPEKVALPCPPMRIELPDSSCVHRFENHDEYFLSKLFRSGDRSCHVHQESEDGGPMQMVEAQEGVLVSLLQTLGELSVRRSEAVFRIFSLPSDPRPLQRTCPVLY